MWLKLTLAIRTCVSKSPTLHAVAASVQDTTATTRDLAQKRDFGHVVNGELNYGIG